MAKMNWSKLKKPGKQYVYGTKKKKAVFKDYNNRPTTAQKNYYKHLLKEKNHNYDWEDMPTNKLEISSRIDMLKACPWKNQKYTIKNNISTKPVWQPKAWKK